MVEHGVFKRSMPSDLIRGWRPVRVKKTRQIKNLEPRFDSIETEKALVGWRLGCCFERRSDLSCARQCPSDVGVFRTELEGDQPVAMLAVDLKTGPDLLRALPKYLGALRAFNSDLVINHEIHPKHTLSCGP